MALSNRTRYYSRFEARIPYQTPDSFDEFQGPTTGTITVDHNICTAPDPSYDLSDVASVNSLYSATIRDGTVEQQRQIINKDLFLKLWPELNLPGRCLDIWETKFPELVDLWNDYNG